MAWSTEALERGVQHARNGDLDAAMPLYQQALQLDPSNADAMVAQGAALANVRSYQDAVDVLLQALGMSWRCCVVVHAETFSHCLLVQRCSRSTPMRSSTCRPSRPRRLRRA